MSYRSFTDILGETSLERKCRFLFGLCLLVLITGSFWWYGSLTEQLVYATTRSTGRHLVDDGPADPVVRAGLVDESLPRLVDEDPAGEPQREGGAAVGMDQSG